METEKFNWETMFETAAGTMTHVFSDRVKVIVDFKFETVALFRDEDTIAKFSFTEKKLNIDDYERFLIETAKDAERLKTLGL
jgi:hypothetical protein